MKFREHRGTLAESMETVIEVKDRDDLIDHMRDLLLQYDAANFHKSSVRIEEYVQDPRNGWNTYIVSIDGYGVMGFTDGPL